MIDIEQEIQGLSIKYGFAESHNYFMEVLEELLREQTEGKRVIIRGAGAYAKRMLSEFYTALKPQYIVDMNPALESLEIPYASVKIPVRDMSCLTEDIEVAVIGSYELRDELKKGLPEKTIVVDLNDLLEEYGVCLNSAYYYWSGNPYIGSIILNNRYKMEKSPEKRAEILKKIISLHASNRDIFMLKKYIQEYTALQFAGWEQIAELGRELEALLIKIKNELERRKERDIIWFWQDALNQEWVEYMPYTKGCREKGIRFENTYSSSVWTRCMYSLIFDKEYEIDDCSYKDKGRESHILIDYLQDKGYACIRIGDGGDFETKSLNAFNFKKEKISSFETATSKLNWNTLRAILNSEKPVFLLIHSVLEAHEPICSPDLEEFDSGLAAFTSRFLPQKREKLLDNLKVTCRYLDQQNQWMGEILGRQAVKIFMSDHGSIMTKESRRWNKDANYFNFIAWGGKIPVRREKRLFSLYNFLEFMKYVVEENESIYEDALCNYIKLQSVDVYNKITIENFIKADFGEYLQSFRGAVTERDRYVLLKSGKEIYNIFPDDYSNHIDEQEYQDRIQELREKAGDFFIKDYAEPKFENVRLIYENLNQGKEESL
ncbi:hypothetical protein AALA00_00930 [Lachnospiraceae bacterium 46-15]